MKATRRGFLASAGLTLTAGCSATQTPDNPTPTETTVEEGVHVTDHSLEETDGGKARVTGTLVNNTENIVSATVSTYFQDGHGDRVDEKAVHIHELTPGDESRFEASRWATIEEVAQYEFEKYIWIE